MPIKMVYWDANLFHAIFGREVGRVEICEHIMDAAMRGKVDIYTSTITFAEVVWVKSIVDGKGKLNKLSPDHEPIIQKYFIRSCIKPITCDRQVSELARELMWKHATLKPKDAIHVASAALLQVEVMHSYDDDDLVPLDGKIGAPPLKICHPGNGDGFEIPATLL
jgi:predicted nucleic acid-binding protein